MHPGLDKYMMHLRMESKAIENRNKPWLLDCCIINLCSSRVSHPERPPTASVKTIQKA